MIAIILALAGVFILAPGGASLFDGLPVSGPVEFISAAVLVVLAVSSSTRATLAAGAASIHRLLVALLLAGLFVKAAVVARGSYDGFLGCYEAVAVTADACNVSYDNPFRRHGATRVDAQARFNEKTWRLGLLNKREYDAARDNSPAVTGRSAMDLVEHPPTARHYLPTVPFAATWQSTVTAAAPATLLVRYVGEGAITIDGVATPLEAHFDDAPATQTFAVTAGPHALTMRYRWAPPVDLTAPTPKKAVLSLDAPDGVRFGTSGPADRLLGHVADVVGVTAFALLTGAALGWQRRTLRAIAAPVAIAILVVTLPIPAWWRDKLVELMSIGICLQWIRTRMLILPFVLLLATLGLVRIGWAAGPVPGVVHDRGWSVDALTYDSFAREVFETGTLRAGEDVFRGQPLFRYWRYVERVALGEDEWLIVVSALVLFCLAYSWLARRALEEAPRHLLAVLGTSALLLWIMSGLISFVETAMTEYPTWALVPIATGMLFLGRSKRKHLAAAALMGVGVLFRFNHLPAYLILLAIFALKPTTYASPKMTVAAALVIFALVVCVPMLAHNVYYGHAWRIIPDSAQVNTDLPVEAWTVARVLEKIRYLLHMGTDAPTPFLPLHALQLVILGGAAAVWTGRWRVGRWHGWLFLAPLAALAVHIVFAVNVYYPRHILFAYLLAGALVLVLAAEDGLCDRVDSKLTRQSPSARFPHNNHAS